MTSTVGLPLSVYVHLPWCVRKCPYCDFNSHTLGDAALKERYLDALERDIDAEAAGVRGRTVGTVFIGGGTPSLFAPAQIGRILDALSAALTVAADAEITMEANPGTVERGSMGGYRDAGINRLSLGAQSFDDESLARLGRIHGRDEIYGAFREARAAGFDNINLDLMFALPGQTMASALTDLRAAVELEPEHVSYYQLTLEPNTVFHAQPPEDLPDDEAGADIQDAALPVLAAGGFRRYEVSAFARPGFECRHNLNYWRFGDYLGLGAGAHGKTTDELGRIRRSEKPANPRQYVEAMRSGSPPTVRHPDPDDIVFEYMLNALRLEAGFAPAAFERRTGLAFDRVSAQLESARGRGLMRLTGDGIWRPSELGRRFLNDLQAAFLPSRVARRAGRGG